GNLDWTAYLDDEPYATGTAAAGSKVKVEFKGVESGLHYFSFEVSNGTLKSPMADKKIFIGFDTPTAPENVVLDDTMISWDKVTRGVNAGYMDIDNLVYHVYMNGEEIAVTSENTYSLDSPLSESTYAGYVATVVADNSGILSEVSQNSNMITAGKPWEMPFHVTPTRVEAQAFSAVDGNSDGEVWGYIYNNELDISYFYPSTSGSGSDDWLFSPPLDFSDLMTDYELALDVANVNEWYRNQSVSVWLCTDLNPATAVKKLIDYKPQEKDQEFNRVSQVFAVPEAGTYYIALYAKIGPYEKGLRVKEIDITKTGVSSPRPAEVENIFCQGGPEAALYADVEFDIPTKFLSGDVIPADAEIEVEVKGAYTKVVKGKPGESITMRVDAVQGDNLLAITPIYNGYAGHRSDVNVYCGYDIPGEVQNLSGSVSEDNLRLLMKWDPPTTVGENGYYVDPAQCGYRVYQNTENGWTVVADLDCDAREYALSVAPDNGLRSEWAGVVPVNVAGESPSMPWMSDMLGTPYDLPMEETFTDASLDYPPVRILRITDPEGYTNWTMTNPKSVNDAFANDTGICLMGNTEKAETIGILMLPKFSTKGLKEAMLRLNIWTGLGMPYVTILGEVWDDDTKFEIGRVFVGDGWTDFRFDLPEKMLDREWVALYIMATYPTTNYFVLISNYGITEESTLGVEECVIDATSGRYVRGLTGRVAVDGYEGLPVTVNSLDGKVVSSVASAPMTHIVSLPKGIYIVNAGGEAHKVIVR
ncbi:MAG: hypothetical protein K2G78_02375, partial [Muribaculaceae bacterium]|nr:hypothetical protein [Muribaculaceae bacterium]